MAGTQTELRRGGIPQSDNGEIFDLVGVPNRAVSISVDLDIRIDLVIFVCILCGGSVSGDVFNIIFASLTRFFAMVLYVVTAICTA
ncbi:hypothetical protein AURDEDRAFT_159363 [Auricularia subglabra TFB-10046 SS5]|nr:hypothetical protein AURDEDRAFT_159363 [Auricularia subglabra TFB-10046 SS5]